MLGNIRSVWEFFHEKHKLPTRHGSQVTLENHIRTASHKTLCQFVQTNTISILNTFLDKRGGVLLWMFHGKVKGAVIISLDRLLGHEYVNNIVYNYIIYYSHILYSITKHLQTIMFKYMYIYTRYIHISWMYIIFFNKLPACLIRPIFSLASHQPPICLWLKWGLE